MLVLRLMLMVLTIICLIDGHAEVSSSTTGIRNGTESPVVKPNEPEVQILDRKKKKKPKKPKKPSKKKKPKPKKPKPAKPVTTTPTMTTSTLKTATILTTPTMETTPTTTDSPTTTTSVTTTSPATTTEATSSTTSITTATTTIPTTTTTTTAATTADSGAEGAEGECKATNGKPCIFPFKDGNEEYNECKNHGGTYFWCATSVYESGKYKHWSYCPKDGPCPLEGHGECRAKNNKPCVFPFKDGEKEYNECADHGGQYFWCATGTNSAGKYTAWSECPKDGSCPLPQKSTTPAMTSTATAASTTPLITGTTVATDQMEEKVFGTLENLVLGESRDDSLQMAHMLDKKLDTIIKDLEGETSKTELSNFDDIPPQSGKLNLTLKRRQDDKIRDGTQLGKGLMFVLSTVDSMKSVSRMSGDCCLDCTSKYPDTELAEYWETLDTCYCYKKFKNPDVKPKTRASSKFTTKACANGLTTNIASWEYVKTKVFIEHGNKAFKCDVTFEFSLEKGIAVKNTQSLCSESSAAATNTIHSIGEHSFELTSKSLINFQCTLAAVLIKKQLSTEVLENTLNCSVKYDQCITMEGNNFPSKCKFPFIYKKRKYYGCTDIDSQDPTKLWCPTELNEKEEVISNQFGYCTERCPYCGGSDIESIENPSGISSCGSYCIIHLYEQELDNLGPIYPPEIIILKDSAASYKGNHGSTYEFKITDSIFVVACPGRKFHDESLFDNSMVVAKCGPKPNHFTVSTIYGVTLTTELTNKQFGCDPCPRQFTFLPGYPSNADATRIRVLTSLLTIEGCKENCENLPSCKAFIYIEIEEKCELLSEINNSMFMLSHENTVVCEKFGTYDGMETKVTQYPELWYYLLADIKDDKFNHITNVKWELYWDSSNRIPFASVFMRTFRERWQGDYKPVYQKNTGFYNPNTGAVARGNFMSGVKKIIYPTDEEYKLTHQPGAVVCEKQPKDRGHLLSNNMITTFIPNIVNVASINKERDQLNRLVINFFPQQFYCNRHYHWRTEETAMYKYAEECLTGKKSIFYMIHALIPGEDFIGTEDPTKKRATINIPSSIFASFCCIDHENKIITKSIQVLVGNPDGIPAKENMCGIRKCELGVNMSHDDSETDCVTEVKSYWDGIIKPKVDASFSFNYGDKNKKCITNINYEKLKIPTE